MEMIRQGMLLGVYRIGGAVRQTALPAVREAVQPLIGAAGISAFPMSAWIVQRVGQEADHENFLLNHLRNFDITTPSAKTCGLTYELA